MCNNCPGFYLSSGFYLDSPSSCHVAVPLLACLYLHTFHIAPSFSRHCGLPLACLHSCLCNACQPPCHYLSYHMPHGLLTCHLLCHTVPSHRMPYFSFCLYSYTVVVPSSHANLYTPSSYLVPPFLSYTYFLFMQHIFMEPFHWLAFHCLHAVPLDSLMMEMGKWWWRWY